MEISNITLKLKTLKLDLSDDLFVNFVRISLRAQQGQSVEIRRINGLYMSLLHIVYNTNIGWSIRILKIAHAITTSKVNYLKRNKDKEIVVAK